MFPGDETEARLSILGLEDRRIPADAFSAVGQERAVSTELPMAFAAMTLRQPTPGSVAVVAMWMPVLEVTMFIGEVTDLAGLAHRAVPRALNFL